MNLIPKPEIFAGIVGEVVETFAPHTEADPVGIAGQFLIALGNAVGRGPHCVVGETVHHMNEYVAAIGETARSRKGDSLHLALRPFQDVDPAWSSNVTGGLSSGEGLIHCVRDPVEKTDGEGETRVVDEGITDKRLLVAETEFAGTLKQFLRDGNTLSPVLRDAWDGKHTLRTLTKNSPSRATGAHISLIVHATQEDLCRYLGSLEIANGMANRFMFILVRRSQLLPNPGRVSASKMEALVKQVRGVLTVAQKMGEIRRTRDADRHWAQLYEHLTIDRPALLGKLLARAEAHVLRLSCLYALAAGRDNVELVHLQSALAFWDFVEASTAIIFQGRTGDDHADRIRAAMAIGEHMSQAEITDRIFKNHITAGQLSAALKVLIELGEVVVTNEPTAGRSRCVITRTDSSRTRVDNTEGVQETAA